MRDALRRAVTPDSRSAAGVREVADRGPRMQCPAHGSAEMLDGEARCPVMVLETVVALADTPDFAEGVDAFLAKRPPAWRRG